MKNGQIITVALSNKDIQHGEPRHCSKCPWALAFKRSGHDVIVASRSFWDNTSQAYYRLPKAVCEWIKGFDASSIMRPLTVRFKLVRLANFDV